VLYLAGLSSLSFFEIISIAFITTNAKDPILLQRGCSPPHRAIHLSSQKVPNVLPYNYVITIFLYSYQGRFVKDLNNFSQSLLKSLVNSMRLRVISR